MNNKRPSVLTASASGRYASCDLPFGPVLGVRRVKHSTSERCVSVRMLCSAVGSIVLPAKGVSWYTCFVRCSARVVETAVYLSTMVLGGDDTGLLLVSIKVFTTM